MFRILRADSLRRSVVALLLVPELIVISFPLSPELYNPTSRKWWVLLITGRRMLIGIWATTVVLAVAFTWESSIFEIERTLNSSKKDVNWPRWLALHLTMVAVLIGWT